MRFPGHDREPSAGNLRVSRPRFCGLCSFKRFGGHSGGETPGYIPNPEVKPSSADGTAPGTVWESRTPPDNCWRQAIPFTGVAFFISRPFSGSSFSDAFFAEISAAPSRIRQALMTGEGPASSAEGACSDRQPAMCGARLCAPVVTRALLPVAPGGTVNQSDARWSLSDDWATLHTG